LMSWCRIWAANGEIMRHIHQQSYMLYKYIIIYIYTCNMYRYHFSIYWGNLCDFTFTHRGFSRSFLFCNRNPDLFYCWLILGCTFPVNFHFPSQTVKSHSYTIFNHIQSHEMTVIRWMVAKSCTSWKRSHDL
jgi:hypothetical protein